MYGVAAMSSPYGIVESPPNNWPEFAILKFALLGGGPVFPYRVIGPMSEPPEKLANASYLNNLLAPNFPI
jgi:hypothetical protein